MFLKTWFRRLLDGEHGQEVVEYALALGFVGAAAGALFESRLSLPVRLVCAAAAVGSFVLLVRRRRRPIES